MKLFEEIYKKSNQKHLREFFDDNDATKYTKGLWEIMKDYNESSYEWTLMRDLIEDINECSFDEILNLYELT